MEEPDLGGVPVARRAEVRRRIGLIEDFLALAKPSKADRLALRAALGVSRPMLYVLLRAWRRDRDPASLPGAFRPRTASGRSATRKGGVEPLILETLTALPPDATGGAFMRALQARCATAGVERPSKAYLLRRLREHRADEPVRFADRPLLYVDFCAVDAGPVADGHGNPVVAAAILLPERAIVAHRTLWHVPGAADAAAVLADALARGAERQVATPRLHGLGGETLRRVLGDADLLFEADRYAVARRFRPAAGERLGTLRLHPGRAVRPRNGTPPPDAVVVAVAAVVDEAVAEHAARHPDTRPATSLVPVASEVVGLLRWLAAMPAEPGGTENG